MRALRGVVPGQAHSTIRPISKTAATEPSALACGPTVAVVRSTGAGGYSYVARQRRRRDAEQIQEGADFTLWQDAFDCRAYRERLAAHAQAVSSCPAHPSSSCQMELPLPLMRVRNRISNKRMTCELSPLNQNDTPCHER
jgi:hypothetical protein